MKQRLFSVLIIGLCLGLLSLSMKAQQMTDPDEVETQIIQEEAQNLDEMSSSVQKLTKERKLQLYQEYIESVSKQIDLLAKRPDPTGIYSKKRDEYISKRSQYQNRLNETVKTLGNPAAPAPIPAPPTAPAPAASGGKQPADKPPVAEIDSGNKGQNTPSTVKIKSDTNNFTEATPVITKEVDNMVKGIQCNLVDCDGSGELLDDAVSNYYGELFSFSVALGIEKEKSNEQAIFNLAPISYVYETARTDKQIGASASTAASTSQIDKPGFARLLGFAIENGLIEKNVHDTVLTMSTTPAALFTIGEKDYQTAYKNAGVFNNIGLSASFNINNQNSLLGNATRGQLREFSVRYNFFDRSARSPEFQKIFDEEIAPKIKAQLVAVGAIKEFVDNTDNLRELRNSSEPKLKKALNELTATKEFKALANDKQAEALTNTILNFMKSEVFAQLQNESSNLPDTEKTELRQKMNNLLKVQKETVFTEARKHLDKFYKKPLGTIAYLNHRDQMGNYSEFKFLYEQNSTMIKPLALTLNTGFSFYNKPNRMMNQRKIRDLTFALSFEGKTKSTWLEEEDLTPITYSFTGRYARMFENKGVMNRKADLASFQFLVNFPLFRGFGLPLSVTYSNATEMERKSGVRFNFGFKLDADKLFEIALLNRLLGN